MNKALLLGGLLCVLVINITAARHYGERIDSETLSDDDSQADFQKLRERNSQSRHRRRRWQNYGYDYQPPQYFGDRRDSYSNHQELLPQIYRLLEDISSYIRRQQQAPPPPPPQPIYVPYPMPYFIPQYISCKPEAAKVNVTSRFPDLDDVNRNWGIVANDVTDESYDDSDGVRPISFEPIKPKQNNLKRPAPPVEHGSVQTNDHLTTRAPILESVGSASSSKLQPMCNAAVLSCCSLNDEMKRKNCFINVGCTNMLSKPNVCSLESINNALITIKDTYAPMN